MVQKTFAAYEKPLKSCYNKPMHTITNLQVLQVKVWNAFYDVFGFRPRGDHYSELEWNSEAFLEKKLEQLEDMLDNYVTMGSATH